MNLKPFTGPGSTPSRRRFWDKVTQAVIASQKIAGRNVTTDEHDAKGTVINVIRLTTQTGACCDNVGGCTVKTAAECTGTFLGVGTNCSDSEICFGLCCQPECTIHSTPTACAEAGGTFQGFGSGPTCDPDPCCTTCDPLVWQGCTDGDGNCRTGPENCDECTGEIVPCDETFYWFTDIEYCISCPGGELEECCRKSVNQVTCEEISTCEGDPNPCNCDGPGQSGSTHEMQDRGFPCTELSPPP